MKIGIEIKERGATHIIPILSYVGSQDGDSNSQNRRIEDVLTFSRISDRVIEFASQDCDRNGALYNSNLLEIDKDFEGAA